MIGALTAPIFVVFAFMFKDSGGVWEHIAEFLLKDYIITTLKLGLGVSFVSLFVGSLSAYLTTFYEFKFVRFFQWALILPLAYPAYISAYMYGGILGVDGWVNKYLVLVFDISYADISFLDIMNLNGAIFVMSFCFYPYVYLFAKTALRNQSYSIFEAAKVFGSSEIRVFFKVFLPSLRPALAAGVFLAAMEAISDFGVVSYFGVNSFVNGIFKAWAGLGNLQAATKLAAMLMVFVFVLIYLEKIARKRSIYAFDSKGFRPIVRKKLGKFGSALAIILCFLPFLFGFILPTSKLIYWFLLSFKDVIGDDYMSLVKNTFYLAFISTFIITFVGFVLVYLAKLYQGSFSNFCVNIAKLGYSIPGAIVGVGILIVFSFLDSFFISFIDTKTLIFSGSILGLIYGYLVRFLAVSSGAFESSISKIPKTYSEAARSMGYGGFKILTKIDLPLLKGAFGTSFILVFVEILKELPLTLILRPFNFDTLSAYAMELSSQEMLVETSVPSLSIVVMAMIPIIILIKTTIRN